IHSSISSLTTIPARRRLAQDVKHTWELGVHPFGDVILVANVENTESLDETSQAGSLAIMPNPPQGLRQVGLATPDRDVEWTFQCPGIYAFDQPARRFRVVSIS